MKKKKAPTTTTWLGQVMTIPKDLKPGNVWEVSMPKASMPKKPKEPRVGVFSVEQMMFDGTLRRMM